MNSVIMTTYNGDQYILELLNSLRDQIVKPDEVIIADDRSTDQTIEIVRRYIGDYDLRNWNIYINEHNKGWKRNFIDATNMSKGDLIFFCDQDDIWMNYKIQIMSETMEQNPYIDVLAGRYIKFVDKLPDNRGISTVDRHVHKVEIDSRMITCDLPGCVYCVRRSFWNRIVKHWDGTLAHDVLCWATAKQLGTLFVLEIPVIYWRRHDKSATVAPHKALKTNNYRCKNLEELRENLKCLEEIMLDFEIDDSFYLRLNRFKKFYEIRLDMLRRHKPFKAFQLLRYLDCYDRKKQLLLEVYLSIGRD